MSKNSSRLTIFKQFVTFKQEKEVIFTVFFDLTELFDLIKAILVKIVSVIINIIRSFLEKLKI